MSRQQLIEEAAEALYLECVDGEPIYSSFNHALISADYPWASRRESIKSRFRRQASAVLAVFEKAICARCGQLAEGYAFIGDDRYCHPDGGVDCYALASHELTTLANQAFIGKAQAPTDDERESYLPPDLYNKLMAHLLTASGRDGLFLADEVRNATGASKLRRPAQTERSPEFDSLEQELFKHQPVLSMRDGSIAGCQCLDRVFHKDAEDWGTHLAEVFESLRPAQVEPTIMQLAARRSGKSQALIDSMLAQANERGIRVEVVYPQTEPTDAQVRAGAYVIDECAMEAPEDYPLAYEAAMSQSSDILHAAFTAGQEDKP